MALLKTVGCFNDKSYYGKIYSYNYKFLNYVLFTTLLQFSALSVIWERTKAPSIFNLKVIYSIYFFIDTVIIFFNI